MKEDFYLDFFCVNCGNRWSLKRSKYNVIQSRNGIIRATSECSDCGAISCDYSYRKIYEDPFKYTNDWSIVNGYD